MLDKLAGHWLNFSPYLSLSTRYRTWPAEPHAATLLGKEITEESNKTCSATSVSPNPPARVFTWETSVLFKPLITECFSTAEPIIQVLTRSLCYKWMSHWKKRFLIHMAITQPVLVLQQNACVSRQRVSYTMRTFTLIFGTWGEGFHIFPMDDWKFQISARLV